MLTEGLSYTSFIFASMRLHAYPKVLEWSDLLEFFSLSPLPPIHSKVFFNTVSEEDLFKISVPTVFSIALKKKSLKIKT